MITIKIYTEKTYYLNKSGDKEYLDGGEDDKTLIKAAILTGKGLNTEEEYVCSVYEETKKEAEKAFKNYLKANLNHPLISRTETLK